MSKLPLLLILGTSIGLSGCSEPQRTTQGERAERIADAQAIERNHFVGVWSSPTRQTVNDWIVIFTNDGYVAIDGPGLKADGTYHSRGDIASAKLVSRNGATPTGRFGETTFRLSPDGHALVFLTGMPAEAPVELVRYAEGSSPARPSLAAPSDSAKIDPLTLASLDR